MSEEAADHREREPDVIAEADHLKEIVSAQFEQKGDVATDLEVAVQKRESRLRPRQAVEVTQDVGLVDPLADGHRIRFEYLHRVEKAVQVRVRSAVEKLADVDRARNPVPQRRKKQEFVAAGVVDQVALVDGEVVERKTLLPAVPCRLRNRLIRISRRRAIWGTGFWRRWDR